MRYAFFGTPRFAAIIIGKLIEAGHPPALIVCNPDRPVGRKKIITPPPTKLLALEHNITVFQPEKLEASSSELTQPSFDFFAVAAYSKIIPKNVLEIPKHGTFGIHPSLLPKYRGASPIQSVILAGEKETGVTIYQIDEKVDHGPMALQKSIPIESQDTYLTLEEKLANLGGKLMNEVISKIENNSLRLQEQNHLEATMTKKFKTEDGFVDLEKENPEIVLRKVRALNPEPGVWTLKDGKRMKILNAEIKEKTFKLKTIQFEGEKPKTF